MALNTKKTLETKRQACRNGTQQKIAWGKLCGKNINKNFKSLDLSNDVFSAGRGRANDLVLTLNELPEDRLVKVSKVHFIIKRATCELNSTIYIKDVSLNGTFVNCEQIGQNQTRVLNDGDVISLSLPTNNTFVFMDLRLPAGLAKRYCVVRQLGAGSFGLVRLVNDTRTGQQFAMKIVRKNRVSRARACRDPALNEVEIMKNLSHPCVVCMHEFVDRPEAVYILLELMSGGDLLERIERKKRLSEEISKLYFYQMCHAIKYIHSRNIIHRDFKLENILLKTNNEETLLKVSDFGLSMFVPGDSPSDGTPTSGKTVYTKKGDIWSLGVVLFCCLSGSWPFSSNDDAPLRDQIVEGKVDLIAPEWKHVSKDAKLLIKKILTVDPEKRPSIDDILQCSWLRDAPMQHKAGKLMKLQSEESGENVLRVGRSWTV